MTNKNVIPAQVCCDCLWANRCSEFLRCCLTERRCWEWLHILHMPPLVKPKFWNTAGLSLTIPLATQGVHSNPELKQIHKETPLYSKNPFEYDHQVTSHLSLGGGGGGGGGGEKSDSKASNNENEMGLCRFGKVEK